MYGIPAIVNTRLQLPPAGERSAVSVRSSICLCVSIYGVHYIGYMSVTVIAGVVAAVPTGWFSMAYSSDSRCSGLWTSMSCVNYCVVLIEGLVVYEKTVEEKGCRSSDNVYENFS